MPRYNAVLIKNKRGEARKGKGRKKRKGGVEGGKTAAVRM